MIRELIEKCPDREAESVIADWCEENGRPELVRWLRAGDPLLRIHATKHLANTLEEPLITVASLRTFGDICRNLPLDPARKWLRWYEALIRPQAPPQKEHYFFVRSFERLEDGTLNRVAWAFAGDLASTTQNIPSERIVPLAQIATEPCPTCKRTGLVVGCEEYWIDAARDNAYRTECHVLCIFEPHVDTIGMTPIFWDGASV